MIKNITLLTKLFTINYIENLNIIDKKNNKINLKSIYVWMIIILLIAICFVSNKMVKYLQSIGQETIFPNIYFTFIFLLLVIQTILVCPNVFYFFKDSEMLLPYPIKSTELFLAKFNTILSILYITELIFMLIPIVMYGIAIHIGIGFYIALLIEMVLMPVFVCIIITFINILFIHLFKIIKNENIYQFLISVILITIIFLGEYIFISNAIKEQNLENTLMNLNDIASYINNTTIIINPFIEILHEKNVINNIIKLFILYIVTFIFLTYIGSKTYFKKLLSIKSYR